mmetsp:Transcript_41248/g.128843  ORF Transcript_41248/g.128843 Transcript_41248/m.128843 type:complete len:114 (+) Transcript_41248:105-446(+)
MHDQIPLTPMGMVLMLFSPPWLYVLLVLILLCCCGAMFFMFKESIMPFVFMILDVGAAIGRTVVAIAKGTFWCCAYMFYPVKERTLNCVDRCDGYFRPYKNKQVRTDVPSFVF